MGLPQTYAIHISEDGVPIVNSREVAGGFDKQHGHVLRDIDSLLLAPDLEPVKTWFRQTVYIDSTGRTLPAFDMTRDGFVLLVMGYTGERAMALKIAWIQAFNEMEAQLKGTAASIVTYDQLIGTVRELVGPLSIRFDGQDQAIERLENRVESVAEDVANIKYRLGQGRRRISDKTKCEHVRAIHQLGGMCPFCGIVKVVDENGKQLPFTEFDHMYANSQPSIDHTWLICKPDHTGLTTGRIPRDQADPHFRAYQDKRRRLLGEQIRLF